MNGTCRNPVHAAVVFLAFAGLFFWLMHEPSSSSNDKDLYLGEWTDPHGEPGNYIRFGYRKIDVPNNPVPLMEMYEGRATFHKHLGQDEATVIYNFESTTPLRLNVTVPGNCNFAAIQMVSHDRMLVRFTKTIEAAAGEDVFDAPDVKALVRVREGKFEK